MTDPVKMDSGKRNRLAVLGLLGALLIVPIHEGLRLIPYRDTGRVATDCFGHTGSDVVMGKASTETDCGNHLADDLITANTAVNSCVHYPLTANQRSAFVDFTYNVGGSAFCRSGIVKAINSGSPRSACVQLLRWVWVGKKDCRMQSSNCAGIVDRRKEEFQLCMRRDEIK
ncbi:MAG: lysozyme [bacterium]|nr:lysozyme [bacterium]